MRLARTISSTYNWVELMHECLWSSQLAAAFFDMNTLHPKRSPPWTWARGNIVRNLLDEKDDYVHSDYVHLCRICFAVRVLEHLQVCVFCANAFFCRGCLDFDACVMR